MFTIRVNLQSFFASVNVRFYSAGLKLFMKLKQTEGHSVLGGGIAKFKVKYSYLCLGFAI